MHPSSSFRNADPVGLISLIRERGFALIVTARESTPFVTHTPVVMHGDRLHFHVSLASALAEPLLAGSRALAIVDLDDAYISPDWYLTPNQVPTWNYRSVEAEGPVDRLSSEEVVDLLDALSAQYEARLAPKPPWTRAKMDEAAFARLLKGIVGFSMRIERLEGTLKLSQNKPVDVRSRVASALETRPDPGAQSIARAMLASMANEPSST